MKLVQKKYEKVKRLILWQILAYISDKIRINEKNWYLCLNIFDAEKINLFSLKIIPSNKKNYPENLFADSKKYFKLKIFPTSYCHKMLVNFHHHQTPRTWMHFLSAAHNIIRRLKSKDNIPSTRTSTECKLELKWYHITSVLDIHTRLTTMCVC